MGIRIPRVLFRILKLRIPDSTRREISRIPESGLPYTGESLVPDVKQTYVVTLRNKCYYSCLRWVVLWRQTSYSASVDVTIFERGCAYFDTGNLLEKSLQRLKKERPEVKTFLNSIVFKDRSLTAELISKCDSIELVWGSLGPQNKKRAAFFSHWGAWLVPGYPGDKKLSETSLFI